MEFPKIIEFDFVDLALERNYEKIQYRLELHGDFFLYACEYYCESKDGDDDEDIKDADWKPWKEGVYRCIISNIERRDITAVELQWVEASAVWKVIIAGRMEVKIYLKNRREAERLFNTVIEYRYPDEHYR